MIREIFLAIGLCMLTAAVCLAISAVCITYVYGFLVMSDYIMDSGLHPYLKCVLVFWLVLFGSLTIIMVTCSDARSGFLKTWKKFKNNA